MYLQLERREKTALMLSLNADLVSSWDGRPYMSQLSQSTVMFVVNLKKSFKVIVKPEKIEQNKLNKQMY